jgi:hypothetical protein
MHSSFRRHRRSQAALCRINKNDVLAYARGFIDGDSCDDLTPAQFSRVAEQVCAIFVEKTFLDAEPRIRVTSVDFARARDHATQLRLSVMTRLCNHSLARRGTWLAMMRKGVSRYSMPAALCVASCDRAMRDGVVRARVVVACGDVATVVRMMGEGRRGEYLRIFRHAVGQESVGALRDARWVPIFEKATTEQLAELKAFDIELALRSVGDNARPYLLGLVAHWPRPE